MSASSDKAQPQPQQKQTQVDEPNTTQPPQQKDEKNDNTIKQDIIINGKTYEMSGTVNIKITPKKDEPDVPDPEDPLVKPVEGTIKSGGWGANQDPKSWVRTTMKNPTTQWKVVDNVGKNVATNFTTPENADNFITYFQRHPDQIPSTEEPDVPDGDNGGGGTGGNGHGGGGGGGGGTSPPPGVEGQSVHGVNIPFALTGKTRDDPKYNKRDDGLRLDYDNPPDGSYVNSVQVFYGTFKGKVPDDDITFKWSWARHTGNATVKAYGIGLDNKTGKLRGRMEWNHPDYTSNLATGTGGKPIEKGKVYGYMGIKRTLPNGNIELTYYQDQGGLGVDGKPANQWKKLLVWEDKEYKVTDYKENGCECTTRIDTEKGWDNVDVKLSFIAEIKP